MWLSFYGIFSLFTFTFRAFYPLPYTHLVFAWDNKHRFTCSCTHPVPTNDNPQPSCFLFRTYLTKSFRHWHRRQFAKLFQEICPTHSVRVVARLLLFGSSSTGRMLLFHTRWTGGLHTIVYTRRTVSLNTPLTNPWFVWICCQQYRNVGDFS